MTDTPLGSGVSSAAKPTAKLTVPTGQSQADFERDNAEAIGALRAGGLDIEFVTSEGTPLGAAGPQPTSPTADQTPTGATSEVTPTPTSPAEGAAPDVDESPPAPAVESTQYVEQVRGRGN